MSIDRRQALFPPPPEPGAEQEEFAPNPSRLTQPTVESGLLGIEPGIQPRHPGTKVSVPFEEGRELRPESALVPEPGGFVIRHEHHHVVETRDARKEAGPMVRITLDTSGVATRLLARDSDRWRATILNLSSSASTITLGTSQVAAGDPSGYDLVAGAALDIHHDAPVHAAIPSGGSATVCIIITRWSPHKGDNQSPLGVPFAG